MPTIDIIVSATTTVIDVVAQRAGVQGPVGADGPIGPAGPPGENTGVSVSTDPPGSPVTGQLWFESDSGALLIFYDDTWVQLNLVPIAAAEGVVTHDDVDVTHDSVIVTHT